jgi:ATP-dependent Clp protease ATP-binding subunit ClpA
MYVNFDAFTEESQAVARQVIVIATRFHHTHLDLEHVMLSLLDVPGSGLGKVFDLLSIEKEQVQRSFELILSNMEKADEKLIKAQQFTISPRMKKVIDEAQYEANRLWDKEIKPVHLFIASVRIYLGSEKNSTGGKIIAKTGITPDKIRDIAVRASN